MLIPPSRMEPNIRPKSWNQTIVSRRRCNSRTFLLFEMRGRNAIVMSLQSVIGSFRPIAYCSTVIGWRWRDNFRCLVGLVAAEFFQDHFRHEVTELLHVDRFHYTRPHRLFHIPETVFLEQSVEFSGDRLHYRRTAKNQRRVHLHEGSASADFFIGVGARRNATAA